jgi:hypothetical protein
MELYVRAWMASIWGNLDSNFSPAGKVFCDAVPRFGFFVFHFALTSAALLTRRELTTAYILTRTALAMGQPGEAHCLSVLHLALRSGNT